MHHQRGFTLIELLVVFAMIALLVGLVPIAFGRMHEGAQYRTAVRTLLSEMRAARYQAVSQGVDVLYVVDLAQRRFGPAGRPGHVLPEPMQLRATFASQATAADGSAGILFLRNGGSTGGSIDVERNPGNGTRLRVDWFSGRVSLEPLTP